MRSQNGQIGHQVGRFRLETLVARGLSGNIYVAHDIREDDLVTLRILRGSFTPDNEVLKDFRWSVRAAREVKHPVIAHARLLGVSADNQLYLVNDYISDYALQEQFTNNSNDGLLSPVYALEVVHELAEGLMVAHRRGIVHKCLTPENILLRADGSAILLGLDLPASYSFQDMTQEVEALDYLSPEQRLGKALDARSNIYSLGAILYRLLIGHIPQPVISQTNRPTIHKLEGLQQIHGPTRRVLYGCLQEQGWARFQSMQELMQAVDEAVRTGQGTQPVARPRARPEPPPVPSPVPSPARPAILESPYIPSHHRWWLLALLALLLLLWGLAALTLGAPEDSPASEPAVLATETENGDPTADSPRETTVPATEDQLPTAPTTVTEATAESGGFPPADPLPTPTLAVTPSPPTEPGAVIAPAVATVPTIDGDLADWPAGPAAASTWRVYSAAGWDGSADLAAEWRLMWDPAYLYVGVTIRDDRHVQTETGSQMYRGDSLEMQIDTDRAGDYGPALSPDDFQILLSPGDFQTLPPAAFRFRADETGAINNAPDHNIQVAARPTGEGYTLEAAIPWLDLATVPESGLVLGLALNANDNDQPGTAVQEVMLSNVASRTLTDPTTWGTLELR